MCKLDIIHKTVKTDLITVNEQNSAHCGFCMFALKNIYISNYKKNYIEMHKLQETTRKCKYINEHT